MCEYVDRFAGPSRSEGLTEWIDYEKHTAADDAYAELLPRKESRSEMQDVISAAVKSLLKDYRCKVKGKICSKVGEDEKALVKRLRKIYKQTKPN